MSAPNESTNPPPSYFFSVVKMFDDIIGSRVDSLLDDASEAIESATTKTMLSPGKESKPIHVDFHPITKDDKPEETALLNSKRLFSNQLIDEHNKSLEIEPSNHEHQKEEIKTEETIVPLVEVYKTKLQEYEKQVESQTATIASLIEKLQLETSQKQQMKDEFESEMENEKDKLRKDMNTQFETIKQSLQEQNKNAMSELQIQLKDAEIQKTIEIEGLKQLLSEAQQKISAIRVEEIEQEMNENKRLVAEMEILQNRLQENASLIENLETEKIHKREQSSSHEIIISQLQSEIESLKFQLTSSLERKNTSDAQQENENSEDRTKQNEIEYLKLQLTDAIAAREMLEHNQKMFALEMKGTIEALNEKIIMNEQHNAEYIEKVKHEMENQLKQEEILFETKLRETISLQLQEEFDAKLALECQRMETENEILRRTLNEEFAQQLKDSTEEIKGKYEKDFAEQKAQLEVDSQKKLERNLETFEQSYKDQQKESVENEITKIKMEFEAQLQETLAEKDAEILMHKGVLESELRDKLAEEITSNLRDEFQKMETMKEANIRQEMDRKLSEKEAEFENLLEMSIGSIKKKLNEEFQQKQIDFESNIKQRVEEEFRQMQQLEEEKLKEEFHSQLEFLENKKLSLENDMAKSQETLHQLQNVLADREKDYISSLDALAEKLRAEFENEKRLLAIDFESKLEMTRNALEQNARDDDQQKEIIQKLDAIKIENEKLNCIIAEKEEESEALSKKLAQVEFKFEEKEEEVSSKIIEWQQQKITMESEFAAKIANAQETIAKLESQLNSLQSECIEKESSLQQESLIVDIQQNHQKEITSLELKHQLSLTESLQKLEKELIALSDVKLLEMEKEWEEKLQVAVKNSKLQRESELETEWKLKMEKEKAILLEQINVEMLKTKNEDFEKFRTLLQEEWVAKFENEKARINQEKIEENTQIENEWKLRMEERENVIREELQTESGIRLENEKRQWESTNEEFETKWAQREAELKQKLETVVKKRVDREKVSLEKEISDRLSSEHDMKFLEKVKEMETELKAKEDEFKRKGKLILKKKLDKEKEKWMAQIQTEKEEIPVPKSHENEDISTIPELNHADGDSSYKTEDSPEVTMGDTSRAVTPYSSNLIESPIVTDLKERNIGLESTISILKQELAEMKTDLRKYEDADTQYLQYFQIFLFVAVTVFIIGNWIALNYKVPLSGLQLDLLPQGKFKMWI